MLGILKRNSEGEWIVAPQGGGTLFHEYPVLPPQLKTQEHKLVEGSVVKFDIVQTFNPNAVYTIETGWSENPVSGFYAKISGITIEIED